MPSTVVNVARHCLTFGNRLSRDVPTQPLVWTCRDHRQVFFAAVLVRDDHAHGDDH
jgi:hypothetical protein